MWFTKLFQTDERPLIVSFPKSGRTWLRVMLDDLGVTVQYSHDGTDHGRRKSLHSLNENKSRYKGRRTVLLVRDPRDTVVSGYFQVQKRHNIPVGSFSDFIRSDEHGIEKIIRFNTNWFLAVPRLPTVRCVQYEDIHRDTVGVLHSILEFLSVQVDDRALAKVADARTFQKMRSSEAKGDLGERYGAILLPSDVNDPESYKVRKGKIGGYRDYLSDDDVGYCDDLLLKSGYWAKLDKVFRQNGLNYQPIERSRIAV
ncbi:MAG: hypothetical protein EOR60_07625 [Mesorhizobium sp.]|nr:MAG: hypothetical protein EOR60_07625 [Mesorhizobium sp.]